MVTRASRSRQTAFQWTASIYYQLESCAFNIMSHESFELWKLINCPRSECLSYHQADARTPSCNDSFEAFDMEKLGGDDIFVREAFLGVF
jgi:hypothetical protein